MNLAPRRTFLKSWIIIILFSILTQWTKKPRLLLINVEALVLLFSLAASNSNDHSVFLEYLFYPVGRQIDWTKPRWPEYKIGKNCHRWAWTKYVTWMGNATRWEITGLLFHNDDKEEVNDIHAHLFIGQECFTQMFCNTCRFCDWARDAKTSMMIWFVREDIWVPHLIEDIHSNHVVYHRANPKGSIFLLLK